MTDKRCAYCGELLVVKECVHGLRGPLVSFFPHPACDRALNSQ